MITTKIRASCLALTLLVSTSALAYEDDATAAKAVPVVRALPTGSASPENELTITATFDDLINRQFDIRMKQTIEQFKDGVIAEVFDKLAPVGHILISTKSLTPNQQGYVGVWKRIDADTSLISTNIHYGSIEGSNSVGVPLPYHAHDGSTSSVTLNKVFYSNSTGNHTHGGTTSAGGGHSHELTLNGVSGDDRKQLVGAHWGYDRIAYGVKSTASTSVSGQHTHGMSLLHAGNHAHSVPVNFGGHSHHFKTNGQGVSGAKIDVRGKRLLVAVWERIS
ncbi:hypothetical protein I3271_07420 [Photobacterium leiognathi]|uniref:hypothetical protein n=1 Tax=Photobacterium leiognathi TaxID=553611 RepID=UPI001EDD8E18|nr:hypothetical protein [Photobacterium leiognathi]MCG3884515.1 hypothetical protein [Photobacterium leiognathi]